jgi:membrane protease YdiL (CAAX protease family)
MQNILRNTPTHNFSPWMIFIVTMGLVIASLFAFQFLGLLAIAPFFDYDVNQILEMLLSPAAGNETKVPILIIQGFTALGAFIIAPYIVITRNLKIPFKEFFILPSPVLQSILMTFFIVFCFMVINSVAIEWNQNISLPEVFSGFEQWAQQKELELEVLTKHITTFDNTNQFILAILVVAILPGIGEELLFRGLLQNVFHKILKNPHFAIWFSAFLFSLFHFQFYGLIPRMFLGALFGYLYFWSGSLSLAMIAHFLNNGFMLVMIYLNSNGVIEYDLNAENTLPEIGTLVFFAALTVSLLFTFYKLMKNRKNEELAESV